MDAVGCGMSMASPNCQIEFASDGGCQKAICKCDSVVHVLWVCPAYSYTIHGWTRGIVMRQVQRLGHHSSRLGALGRELWILVCFSEGIHNICESLGRLNCMEIHALLSYITHFMTDYRNVLCTTGSTQMSGCVQNKISAPNKGGMCNISMYMFMHMHWVQVFSVISDQTTTSSN